MRPIILIVFVLFQVAKNFLNDPILENKRSVEVKRDVNVEFQKLESSNSKFLPIAIEIMSKEYFDRYAIIVKLVRINEVIRTNEKYKNNLTYISLKLQKLEIAAITNSEFLIYRIISDIEKDLNIFY